jgi:hypothetical protein
VRNINGPYPHHSSLMYETKPAHHQPWISVMTGGGAGLDRPRPANEGVDANAAFEMLGLTAAIDPAASAARRCMPFPACLGF